MIQDELLNIIDMDSDYLIKNSITAQSCIHMFLVFPSDLINRIMAWMILTCCDKGYRRVIFEVVA